jgi:putative colanic acid biosynthesis acetyltransferase WcaF
VSDTPGIDVAAARSAGARSRERLGRALWRSARPLFAWSPTPFHAWRRALLRAFGARIGRAVAIYPSVEIAQPWRLEIGEGSAVGPGAILYSLGEIRLGTRVTVSQRAHLCAATRNHRRRDFPLERRAIRIDDDAWIATEAFVGPGVSVGRGAVVAARAVAVRDVEAWQVVAGNPARPVSRREIAED